MCRKHGRAMGRDMILCARYKDKVVQSRRLGDVPSIPFSFIGFIGKYFEAKFCTYDDGIRIR